MVFSKDHKLTLQFNSEKNQYNVKGFKLQEHDNSFKTLKDKF